MSYLIGNADPFASATAPRLRTRLRRRGERVLARVVWRRLDRVVSGTDSARETYARLLGPASPRTSTETVPALPTRAPGGARAAACDPRPSSSWAPSPSARACPCCSPPGRRCALERPDAPLVLLGKGRPRAGRPRARRRRRLRHRRGRPRAEPHPDVLDAARVLVLPSQPSPTWREQVGLPIVEGLSHGCTIVTTDGDRASPTGWSAHGTRRRRTTDPASPSCWPVDRHRARRARRTADVLADLPARDGRLAADDLAVPRPTTRPVVSA